MGPWITDDDVKQAIGRRLGKDATTLPAWADDVAAKANADATADITTIMLGLGYSIQQIDDWDFVGTYVERLAIWYAFNSPPLRNDGGEAADKPNDPRDMLRTMATIVIAGKAVAPSGGVDVGGIAYGVLDAPACLEHELRKDWFR